MHMIASENPAEGARQASAPVPYSAPASVSEGESAAAVAAAASASSSAVSTTPSAARTYGEIRQTKCSRGK